MGHSINYERITNPDDHKVLNGFVSVYRSAFAEAPYFEEYDPQWVVDHIWKVHIPHCVFVARKACGEVVGLGCAHPILAPESNMRAFMVKTKKSGVEIPFPPEQTMYMSELAVLQNFRRKGVGSSLIAKRQKWAVQKGYTHYCMRTAATGSNSEEIYKSMGAIQAPFVQYMPDNEIGTESAMRIFLYGEL